MGGEGQILKRIPRIKFPQRHVSSSSPGSAASQGNASETLLNSRRNSDPKNIAEEGKASHQPKRTPVTDREIEAIMLGGCM